MTYRLWWTVGYVCTTEKEFKAAKHRLLPAAYEALDDALRRANQVFRAGGVAWLIEGDDKTRLDRRAIEIDTCQTVDRTRCAAALPSADGQRMTEVSRRANPAPP